MSDGEGGKVGRQAGGQGTARQGTARQGKARQGKGVPGPLHGCAQLKHAGQQTRACGHQSIRAHPCSRAAM